MPRILFGRTGTDSLFDPLITELRERGYSTTERQSSPLEHQELDRQARNDLNDVDIVFVVLREMGSTDGEQPGPDPALHQTAREAGELQARLGMDRVILFVEDSFSGLSPDFGVARIRYPAGHPEAGLDDVLARLRMAFPVAQRDLHRQVPFREQVRSPELRGPWALLAVVAVAAGIPLILVLRALGPNSAEPVTETSPAGPTTGADQQRTTCRVDLAQASLFDSAVVCEGAGRLVVEGDGGPWFSGVAAIAVSDGVVGWLAYDAQAGGAGDTSWSVDLVPGTTNLDDRSSDGVSTISLRFDDDFQHIHLFRQTNLQGGVATLTFRLTDG